MTVINIADLSIEQLDKLKADIEVAAQQRRQAELINIRMRIQEEIDEINSKKPNKFAKSKSKKTSIIKRKEYSNPNNKCSEDQYSHIVHFRLRNLIILSKKFFNYGEVSYA